MLDTLYKIGEAEEWARRWVPLFCLAIMWTVEAVRSEVNLGLGFLVKVCVQVQVLIPEHGLVLRAGVGFSESWPHAPSLAFPMSPHIRRAPCTLILHCYDLWFETSCILQSPKESLLSDPSPLPRGSLEFLFHREVRKKDLEGVLCLFCKSSQCSPPGLLDTKDSILWNAQSICSALDLIMTSWRSVDTSRGPPEPKVLHSHRVHTRALAIC